MEHTGGYETPLALACKQAGLIVSLVDGRQIRRYRESFGCAKAKTDAADARLLAMFCKERRPAEWSALPDEYRLLTDMVRHRLDLIEARKAWNCRSMCVAQSELVAAQRTCLLDVLKAQIDDIERAIRLHVDNHPNLAKEVELLDSIEGIDITSAVRILAEMGPVSGYRTPRDLALAAGLCPIPSGSGQSLPRGRLPVYGNMELRNALYMPTIVAMRIKRGLAQFTARISQNGPKVKKTVITAGMRKLAHIVHGVLTTKQPYSAETLLCHMKTGT